MNLIYLNSHDTGRYIQPYGHAVPTPRLQALAQESTLFRQACSAAPTCSPSRAALLTGQAAHSSGMLGLAHRGFSLHTPSRHLAHTLHQAGYHTVQAGVQHVSTAPRSLGYDQILHVGDGEADALSAAVVEVLPTLSRPFYLEVGFFETHREFPPAPAEAGHSVAPPPPLPDVAPVRGDMAGYHASAARLDQGIGRILDGLAAHGLLDDTLILCTTDHGPAFPFMKCNLTDHGIGVMLMLRGPGIPQGLVSDALVSHVDLYPTLCELLDLPKPAWLQGRSLLPLLRGQAEQVNDAVFAEVTYHAAYEPQRAVRTPRYKYIRRFQPRSGPVLANCDDSPSKSYLLEHGWQDRAPELEQLYDLVYDPQERRNLAGDPAYGDVKAELQQRLEQWMADTADPLLDGPVLPPPGVVYNDPQALSPNEDLLHG